MSKKEKKRPVGRPTKYKPEYCELLIEHMREGLSYETFPALVESSLQTIYDWEKKHPDFLEAKRRGVALSHMWWEKQGRKGVWTTPKEEMFNTTVWSTTMKNRFGYRDKQTVTTEDEEGNQKPLGTGLSGEKLVAFIDKMKEVL